jgi:sulfide:quinone oxidoreductase
VVAVDRDPTHRYQPALYLHPVDVLDLDTHERDVSGYLHDDVTFVRATVTGVTPDERRVDLRRGSLDYDRLVVALGHALVPDPPWAGAADAYPFYRPDAARALDERLDRAEGSVRVVVTTPPTSVSCGGAPVKAALLTEDYLADHGVDADVRLTTPGDRVFGGGKKARYDAAVESAMAGRVDHVPEFVPADAGDGTLVARDGRTLAYDLLLPVSRQRCPSALTDGSPLTAPVEGEAGAYVAVDPETLRHRAFDRVYALGDCTDAPTSKTAAAARKQAAVVAANLVADVEGREAEAVYDGFAACPLLTERGRAILAAYDYEGSLAVAPAVESRLAWLADVRLLPPLYWHVWLRGRLLGV